MTYWWLSFADSDLPVGQQFLGAAVVEAPSFVAAVLLSHALGINPGGEVKGIELPRPPNARWRNRLLSIEDLRTLDLELGGRGIAERW